MRPILAAITPKRRGLLLAALIIIIWTFTAATLVGVGPFSADDLLVHIGIDPASLGLARPPEPVVRVATAEGGIELFLTTPELVYPDVPRNRIAPDYERALLADIENATGSIELASFEYNLSSLSAALARAQARGVVVRLALDREGLANPVMAKWAGVVEDAGVAVSWQEGDGFLHSKFVIVDRRVVWTGSWNPTINDTYRNNNNLLRITVPQLVANYGAEFERMAGGAFGTAKSGQSPYPLVRFGTNTVENYFSPHEQVRAHVIDWVSRAESSVDVLAFSFTDDAIADALLARHAAGVPVRAVFEARNAGGSGSEYERLTQSGIIALEDGNCYTMHHKVIIIDERVVIAGSYNFTERAEKVNDENTLILDSPTLAQAYKAEFERVYRQARNPIRCQ